MRSSGVSGPVRAPEHPGHADHRDWRTRRLGPAAGVVPNLVKEVWKFDMQTVSYPELGQLIKRGPGGCRRR